MSPLGKPNKYIESELQNLHIIKQTEKEHKDRLILQSHGPRSINYKTMIIFSVIFSLMFFVSVSWATTSLVKGLTLQVLGFNMLDNINSFPLFWRNGYVFGYFIAVLNLINLVLLWVRSFILRKSYFNIDKLEQWRIYYGQSIIRLWQFITYFVGWVVIVWLISLYPEVDPMTILWIITMSNLSLFFIWDYFAVKRTELKLQNEAVQENIEPLRLEFSQKISFDNKIITNQTDNSINNSKNIHIGSIQIDNSTKNLTNTWDKQLNLTNSQNNLPLNDLHVGGNLENNYGGELPQQPNNKFIGVGYPPEDNQDIL